MLCSSMWVRWVIWARCAAGPYTMETSHHLADALRKVVAYRSLVRYVFEPDFATAAARRRLGRRLGSSAVDCIDSQQMPPGRVADHKRAPVHWHTATPEVVVQHTQRAIASAP